MSKLISQFLLFSLLLCSQLSVALHDIDHQSYDHTEICEIYYSADVPLDVPGNAEYPDPAVKAQLASFLSIRNSAASSLLSYASRAPPVNS